MTHTLWNPIMLIQARGFHYARGDMIWVTSVKVYTSTTAVQWRWTGREPVNLSLVLKMFESYTGVVPVFSVQPSLGAMWETGDTEACPASKQYLCMKITTGRLTVSPVRYSSLLVVLGGIGSYKISARSSVQQSPIGQSCWWWSEITRPHNEECSHMCSHPLKARSSDLP